MLFKSFWLIPNVLLLIGNGGSIKHTTLSVSNQLISSISGHTNWLSMPTFHALHLDFFFLNCYNLAWMPTGRELNNYPTADHHFRFRRWYKSIFIISNSYNYRIYDRKPLQIFDKGLVCLIVCTRKLNHTDLIDFAIL